MALTAVRRLLLSMEGGKFAAMRSGMSSHWWAASRGFSVARLLRFSLHLARRALQWVHFRIKDTEEKEEAELVERSAAAPLHRCGCTGGNHGPESCFSRQLGGKLRPCGPFGEGTVPVSLRCRGRADMGLSPQCWQ